MAPPPRVDAADDDAAEALAEQLRLGGLLIGNGVADHRLDFDTMLRYAYSHMLVPRGAYHPRVHAP